MYTEIISIDELAEGEAKGFEVGENSYLLVRRNGELFAYINRCPHRGVRLEWQPDQFLDYEKQFIQCSTHGALFTIETGLCVAGPCPGKRLESIPVKVEAGRVLIQN